MKTCLHTDGRGVRNRLVLMMAAVLLSGGLVTVARAAESPKTAGIRFSHPRGFYSTPFELTFAPGKETGEIRYTLDGSAPRSGHGAVYRGPISIRGTTVVRAAVVRPDGTASRPQTHTYLFTRDIIRQSPDGLPPAGWPYAWGENTVDYGMDQDVVNDPKYRDKIEDALKSLPVYSLVMDLDDLFGTEGGIYANSAQSGRAWERPGSIELIFADGRKGFQEDCGVRIRGGFSSGGFNPKHGFRLFFRKQYGNGKAKYPVFGEGVSEFDSFDLRCAQNYSWNIGADARGLFVRDQFNRDLQRAMGQPAARGDFCHLFLNGQYWGLYDTCERPEASFAESHFGGDKEEYDVVKTGGVGEGMALEATDGTMEAWYRLHEAARKDLSQNENYFRLLGRKADGTRDPALDVLLDPVNLIDYMLVIWFGGNLDAPISAFSGNRMPNNWFAIRHQSGHSGFRFFIWDAEHTLLHVEEDRTGPFVSGERPEISHPQWLFQRCVENAEFRVLLADRIHLHFSEGGALTSASTLAKFRRRVQEIEEAVIFESARWGDVAGGFPFGPPGAEERKMRIGPDGEPRPVPRTRDAEWRAEVRRIIEEYLPRRSDIVLFQLWRQGYVSDLKVPQAKLERSGQGGGAMARLSVPMDGAEIWYTLDGSDPRKVGGDPSPAARQFADPIQIQADQVITTRARLRGEWSPVVTVRPAGE